MSKRKKDERLDAKTSTAANGPEALPEPPPEAPEEAAAAEKPAAETVAALQTEVAELKDRLLRALAEIENQRKRFERERNDAEKYAAAQFAREILGVADNLRRALDSAHSLTAPELNAIGGAMPEALKTLIEGVEVTEREMHNIFERHDIRRIDPLGQKFDAHLHQAMFEVEDPAQEPGTIVQVIAPGYTIAGRLLRPAMVGVAKGGALAPPGGQIDTSA
jgi:molecular chaperone GrpE